MLILKTAVFIDNKYPIIVAVLALFKKDEKNIDKLDYAIAQPNNINSFFIIKIKK